MVSKERDRARRNRQRFQQLLNELEQQDREIADLYEEAGVEPEELDAISPEPSVTPDNAESPLNLQGFVIRG